MDGSQSPSDVHLPVFRPHGIESDSREGWTVWIGQDWNLSWWGSQKEGCKCNTAASWLTGYQDEEMDFRLLNKRDVGKRMEQQTGNRSKDESECSLLVLQQWKQVWGEVSWHFRCVGWYSGGFSWGWIVLPEVGSQMQVTTISLHPVSLSACLPALFNVFVCIAALILCLILLWRNVCLFA